MSVEWKHKIECDVRNEANSLTPLCSRFRGLSHPID